MTPAPHHDLHVGMTVFITRGRWKGLQAIVLNLLGPEDDYGVSIMTQHGDTGVFESTNRAFKPAG